MRYTDVVDSGGRGSGKYRAEKGEGQVEMFVKVERRRSRINQGIQRYNNIVMNSLPRRTNELQSPLVYRDQMVINRDQMQINRDQMQINRDLIG